MEEIIKTAFSCAKVKKVISDIREQASLSIFERRTMETIKPTNQIRKTIGKTTYIANLHFKEEGKTFPEKLKSLFQNDSK